MADREIFAEFIPHPHFPGCGFVKLIWYCDGGVELRAHGVPAMTNVILAEPRAFPEKSLWYVPDEFEDNFRHDQYRHTSWFTTYLVGRIARADAPSLCPEQTRG